MSPRSRRGGFALAALAALAIMANSQGWFDSEPPVDDRVAAAEPATAIASAASAAQPVQPVQPVQAAASTSQADIAEASAASQVSAADSAASDAASAPRIAAAASAASPTPGPSTSTAAVAAASAGVIIAQPAASASASASAATTSAAAASAAASASIAQAPRSISCSELARQLPNLTAELCNAANLQLSGSSSVEGLPLLQRDLIAPLDQTVSANEPQPPRRPRVLVIGAIHGDEISSTSLVFHWIAHAKETGADMDWRFIPVSNPDGLLQKRPTRTNARGVDLNRNFPTPNWDKEALQYWAKRTKQDVRRYPGPEALSEPESRFIEQTVAHWKPDVIVSIHAPFGVLDYDGPSTPPQRLGRLFLDRVGIYPGSLGNFGGVHRGVPVVTIELPSAIRTPTDTEMRQMWIDLLRWIGERLTPVER